MDSASVRVKEKEHFDKLVEKTGENWWGSTTSAGIQRLQRRAKLLTMALGHLVDPLVLEIGCGVGAFTQYVLAEHPKLRLVGCDVSPRSIDRAKERFSSYERAVFEVTDVTSMKYDDKTFDAVIGNAVLHHLSLEVSLAEIYRVLKPSGFIWFSEPNMMNPQNALERNISFIGKLLQNSESETAFFRWPLAKKLRKAGFQNVCVEPYDFLHPATPHFMIPLFDSIGRLLERILLLRDISGSLLICAYKPNLEQHTSNR